MFFPQWVNANLRGQAERSHDFLEQENKKVTLCDGAHKNKNNLTHGQKKPSSDSK